MVAGTSSPVRPQHSTSEKLSTEKFNSVRQLAASPMSDYYLIVFSVAILSGMGLLMVLSASAVLAMAGGESPYYYATRQIMFCGVGLAGAFVFSRLSITWLQRLAWPGMGLAIVLLLLVLSPLGHHAYGNTNWINIGPVTFQPSEFAKVALVLWAAWIFHVKRGRTHELTQLVIPFLPGAAIIVGLVLGGKDLGTGIVLGLIILSIMFFVGTPGRLLIPSILVVGAGAAYLVMGSANRMARFKVWLDPASDPDAASQPMSAIYALASGGWWGLGLGAGKQKWGGLKNAAHTDYIFAVIGEELGLVGVLVVVAMFVLLIWAGLNVALKSDTMFTRILAASITAWFSIQAIINIMVVLNLLPVLGVPLPFVSSGGSAMMASLFAVGLLLACARNTPEAAKLREGRKPAVKRSRMTSVVAVS